MAHHHNGSLRASPHARSRERETLRSVVDYCAGGQLHLWCEPIPDRLALRAAMPETKAPGRDDGIY